MCHRCRGSEEVTTQVYHWSKGTGTTRHPDQDRCVRWEGCGDDGRVEERGVDIDPEGQDLV